jgi:hypothetical protein
MVVLACAAQAACGSALPGPAAGEPAARASDSDAVRCGLAATAKPRAAALEALHAAVCADAAKRWPEVDAGALQLQTESVTWADGALGCAEPGMLYTQALVPGWRLIVSHGTRQLTYHASRRGAWTWCPPQRAAQPLPGSATR